jgi:hypothetical protein
MGPGRTGDKARPWAVRPLPVLTGHLFNRLFQNDVFPFAEQLREKTFGLLALLAILGVHVANMIFLKYFFDIVPMTGLWQDRCYFLTLFMLLLAFAVLLEWDVLFPDRRDFANLLPLPLKPRTIFLAKFSSLLGFVLIYTLAVNGLASVFLAIYLVPETGREVWMLLRTVPAHFAAAVTANLTLFFMIALFQAAVLLVLSPRLYKRVSALIRFAALVAVISLLLLAVIDFGSWQKTIARFTALRDQGSPSLRFYPPLWFTALYQVLLGEGAPVDRTLAPLAVLAPFVLAGLYFAAMALGYRKHLSRSLESPGRSFLRDKVLAVPARPLKGLLLRKPVERAVFDFFALTLRRSPTHKVRWLGSMAAGTGLALIALYLGGRSAGGLAPTNRYLLSVPIILTFFFFVGLRSLVSVPVAADANWVFRLSEKPGLAPYIAGMKKGIVFLVLGPLFAVLLPLYAYLWGFPTALLHLGYGFVLALILLEVLFFGYAKIPFACSPAPGRAGLHLLWMLYVFGFLVYVPGLDGLEQALFRDPGSFPVFFAAAGLVLLGLNVAQRKWVYPGLTLVHEQRPIPVMITLEESD